MLNNSAIIIPVRLASTRLPNKPLAVINGKSMIQRVYEKALKSGVKNVFIACDGQEIANEVKKFDGNYIITDPNLPSGTDRIYQAAQKLSQNFDYIVNLQGDLPNIDHEVIIKALETLHNKSCDIATLASPIDEIEEINDPNIVKIAISFTDDKNSEGQALYFSRAPIPYSKKDDIFYHHIGIYAYTKNALQKFVSLQPSQLEKRESLEQLRALENNMSIYVRIVDSNPLSVDTQEDLNKITKIIIDEESRSK